MSPFERQIVDAFAATLAGARVRISTEQFSDLAAVLAPRVAAAIDKGVAHSAHIALTGATDFAPAWESALEALRGGPPAAPPPP